MLPIGGTGCLNHLTGEQELAIEFVVHTATVGISAASMADLRKAHDGFLPDLMGADGALA